MSSGENRPQKDETAPFDRFSGSRSPPKEPRCLMLVTAFLVVDDAAQTDNSLQMQNG
jgi:hypothetical protein